MIHPPTTHIEKKLKNNIEFIIFGDTVKIYIVPFFIRINAGIIDLLGEIMGKTIKKIRAISFTLIIIQLIFIAAFFVIYFNDETFKLMQYIDDLTITLTAAGLVIFDCLYVWIIALVVSTLRSKTDLHAAEVIGSDVQEAYNFAMVGLVVTDENDVVIWTNDIFKDRHIDIIDINILDWQPDLRSLKDAASALSSEEVVKIVVNSRNYEVKYLADAGLWIFRDTTEYESTYKYSKEQATVVGILTIDNYTDATVGETEDFNDAVTKVKNVIFTYMKEYGVLLRKFKDDSYSMLCNYQSLEKIRLDNFSIVDRVRQVGIEENVPLTISIGIAHDFPDVIKLNELAAEALDIAMSRGGDQVVLSSYGKEMEFIGGKTEAQEKRNKVKIRVLADSLLSLIRQASNVYIMGHTQMDMDSLGACLGVLAICQRLKKDAKIVIDFRRTEAKTRAALTVSFSKEELENIRTSPEKAESTIQANSLLIVCDVHTPEMVMAPNLVDKASKIVVIDHHRRAEQYIERLVLNHIDPAASSASELVTEFIKFASINPKIELPSIYATIMLSGIFLDSAYFKSKHTGIRTFEACTTLKEHGADNAMADDFLKDEKEEYFTIVGIMKNINFPTYGIACAVADPEREYDSATLAKAANTCLTMKGVKAAFVIGRAEKRIKVSCRSDGSINVQLLAEKLGGGGHFTSAAAVFEKNDIKAAEAQLLNVIDTYLSLARADAKTRKINEED